MPPDSFPHRPRVGMNMLPDSLLGQRGTLRVLQILRALLRRNRTARGLQRRFVAMRVKKSPYGEKTACYDEGLNLFTFSGDWEAIGRNYGAAVDQTPLASAVRRHMDGLSASDRMELERAADSSLERIARYHAGIPRLLEGVASGSGLSLRDVCVANFCTALLPFSALADHCGSFAFETPEGTFIGQNLDLGPRNDTALAFIAPEDAIPFLAHMNPGTIWFSTGMNAAGLVYSGASVNACGNFDRLAGAVPVPLLGLVIQSKATNIAEAVDLLRSLQPFGPANDGAALILGRRREIVHLELSASELRMRHGVPAVATNDFILGGALRTDGVHGELLQLAQARRARARAFLSTTPTPEEAMGFLRDAAALDSWCRTSRFPDLGWTTATYFFDLQNMRVDYWHGPATLDPKRHCLSLPDLVREMSNK